MLISKLYDAGGSEHAYTAACPSIGASFLARMVSTEEEKAGLDGADRRGTCVGE
ncbi:hypothetical protein [Streptomyces sp. RKND-216]|uniref:hypothetical protein n=1 Tax=Streptomyces sp. RKND-216 TaxID=2562581 RepID=UPI001446484F|nr:hypothetical protein [Streptomyces sp. RKND-216]